MRRDDFVGRWNDGDLDFWDAIEFMQGEGYSPADDVIDGDSYDEAVESDIRDYLDNGWWYNLALEELPYRGADYYIRRGMLDYEALEGDELEDFINDFILYMDDHGGWDDGEEDEDEGEDDEPDPDDEVMPSFEESDIVSLLTVCQSDLRVISEDTKRDRESEEKEFERVCLNATVVCELPF